MKKGEIQIGKWHFKFGMIPVYYRNDCMLFHFGVFKMIGYPPEGEMIGKKHYKGFWFRKEFYGFEINL